MSWRSRSAAVRSPHTVAEALAAHPWHSDRRGRRHRCSSGLRSRKTCRHIRTRPSATGIAIATRSSCPHRRPGIDPHGWPRGRPRFIRRHERAFSNLCGASAYTGRPEPGDGGPRRRQPRRSLLSGLPDQQQFIAYTGGRSGWRQDTTDGDRGCARHRIAAGVCARAASASATHRPGCCRDRLCHRPVRSVRPAPHLSHPALGVLAFDDVLRRCSRARRHSGHCARDRDCRD